MTKTWKRAGKVAFAVAFASGLSMLTTACAESTPAERKATPEGPPSVGANGAGITPEESDAVNAAFRRRAPDLQNCWNQQFDKTRDRTLQGDLSIGFTVTTSGALRDVKIVKSSMGNAEVDRCVAATVSKWTFPTVSAELPYDGTVHLGAQF